MLTLTPTISSISTTDSPTVSLSPPPPLSPSPAPAPTPDSQLPTPSLPPAARDFEIHRLALVELLSTRRIAEKFRISQTRVRQIIARVAEWMTEMLPLKSEQDIEKEKNYAIHLAAAQLQNQIEHLQYAWDASSDPKYQRQQTRTIVALARLGVSSHHLDALADKAAPENVVLSRREGQEAEHALQSPAPQPTPAASRGAGFQPAEPSPSSPSSFSIQNSSPPPSEDCSPQTSQASSLKPSASPTNDETSSPTNDFEPPLPFDPDILTGFEIMEKRLLNMIDYAYNDAPRQAYLHESLAEIRQSRANFILQLGPNHPIRVGGQPSADQHSPIPAGAH